MYPSQESITRLIDDLRKLRKDICNFEAASDKAFHSDYNKSQKSNANMLWKQMDVENQLRIVTHGIIESKVIVDLSERDFHVSGMHKYKLWTPTK